MISKTRRFSPGIVLCAGLTLSLASLAQAQPIFQSTFPGGGSTDAARGGVLLTKDGGTISVGESNTFTKGPFDVYIVKTDECGFMQWSATYDFGGNDFGRKIRRTEDGGYIVVGTTDRRNCCNDDASSDVSDADIFLLKIDEKGGVQWAKTYGGTSYDEGTDVQLYPDGGYVATGNTQSFGDGKINGFLMRTDPNGNMIWGRSFGQRLTDQTLGAETLASCTVTAKGDILAAGVSYSFGGGYILVIRTDGDGFTSPNWPNIYPSKGSGNARQIIETSDGSFVVVGSLLTPETNTRDGYMMRIDGTDGTVQFDQAFAEANAKFDDEIAEAHEAFDGNLVLTGYMTNAPGGFAGRDLLLGEVDFKFNPQWFSLHGGKLEDEGYSIDFNAELSKERGDLFVVANGVTQSFTKLSDDDLYLVQALRGGKSGCNDAFPKVKDFRPGLQAKQVNYCHPKVQVHCFAKVGVTYRKGQNLLCTTCKFLKQEENSSNPELGEMKDSGIQLNGLHSEATRVNVVQVKGRTGSMKDSQ